MNHTFLIVVSVISIAVIIVSIYFGTKQCCGQPFKRPEFYLSGPPNSEEANAWIYQQAYLPPADDEVERGGMYSMIDGDGPMLTPAQDPWISQHSYF